MKLGCVVMAAGTSSRFGSNKLAQMIGGKPAFQRSLEAIPAELFNSTVVVTNSSLFSETVKEFNFTEIQNHFPEKGISHTISLALSTLLNCDGVLFCVADQPFLQRSSVENLIQLWLTAPEKIAALACGGARGNPCLFPARYFPELLALQGDRGGSAVIQKHEDQLLLLETDPIELQDIDTPRQLEELIKTI